QYTAEYFREVLELSDMRASIGSVGDAYDNALAETTIGLFKTEAIGKRSPFINGPLQTISDVEWAVLVWVDWFNTTRLHSALGYVTPLEYEATYHRSNTSPATAGLETTSLH
ncbi:MAG: integrase core domain-containing protein, partial [Candidatus Nanopelagicales bacterium]